MRSVFAKEWRQGHMIALFGLLMGGLITALWGILTVSAVHNWQDQQGVNTFCGVMYYIVPIILAIFVGSGLFAAEVERGTLPLLLSLPFSRRQVWLGKVAAGLALMLSAVVLVIIPGAIAVRPALEEVEFWTFLPDLALASVLLYIGAVLWSTVCATIVNAFLSTVVLATVLFIYAVLMLVFGGRLLGPPLLDVELWALSAVPALIVGSYLGFVRGELFKPKRRWLGPIAAAFAVYLVTTVGVIGVVRWGTRYERSKVEAVGGAEISGGGAAAGLVSLGSPVNLHRQAEIRINSGSRAGYRREYAVCLDLKTGKELLIRRAGRAPAVSPDGRYAAVLTGPRPLTWRGQTFPLSQIVEVWDLRRDRLIYRGLPAEYVSSGGAPIEWGGWSPDGRWLALVGRPEYSWRGQDAFLMRPDGSVCRKIRVHADFGQDRTWAFAPSGDLAYAPAEDGSLVRYDLATNTSATIWRPQLEGHVAPQQLAVRPDGRQIAVALHVFLDKRTAPLLGRAERDADVLFAISADGSRSILVSRQPWRIERDAELDMPAELTWSSDTGLLLYLRTYEAGGVFHARVLRWREGAEPTVSSLDTRAGPWYSAIAPDGSILVVSPSQAWLITSHGQLGRLPDGVAGAFEHATITLAGLDAQGRAIIEKWENGECLYLAAVDLQTGQLRRIYP